MYDAFIILKNVPFSQAWWNMPLILGLKTLKWEGRGTRLRSAWTKAQGTPLIHRGVLPTPLCPIKIRGKSHSCWMTWTRIAEISELMGSWVLAPIFFPLKVKRHWVEGNSPGLLEKEAAMAVSPITALHSACQRCGWDWHGWELHGLFEWPFLPAINHTANSHMSVWPLWLWTGPLTHFIKHDLMLYDSQGWWRTLRLPCPRQVSGNA